MRRAIPSAAALLLIWAAPALAERGGPAATPSFTDPVALVTWLIQHGNGHGFRFQQDAATAAVFSPGLRAALRATFARSARLNEPPSGADGDIILDTQEEGSATNLTLNAQPTAPDRTTVSAAFDIAGDHLTRQFKTVLLDGVWKVENIVGADGSSLRRELDCRR